MCEGSVWKRGDGKDGGEDRVGCVLGVVAQGGIGTGLYTGAGAGEGAGATPHLPPAPPYAGVGGGELEGTGTGPHRGRGGCSWLGTGLRTSGRREVVQGKGVSISSRPHMAFASAPYTCCTSFRMAW